MNALVVSEAIPFIEYDLHRQLLNKLRVHGMNAAFGLRTQVGAQAPPYRPDGAASLCPNAQSDPVCASASSPALRPVL